MIFYANFLESAFASHNVLGGRLSNVNLLADIYFSIHYILQPLPTFLSASLPVNFVIRNVSNVFLACFACFRLNFIKLDWICVKYG